MVRKKKHSLLVIYSLGSLQMYQLPNVTSVLSRRGMNEYNIKGIVHFEINFWYVLAYLKRIQDVGVFVSTAFSILTIFGQTVVVCQSYDADLWNPPQIACTEKSKLNII